MPPNASNQVDDPTSRVSRTAIYVAAGRAVGAREPDPNARNPDYLAEKLLGDSSKLGVDHPAVRALGLDYDEAMKDFEVVSNVRMMTVRTRFIDEALGRAVAQGAIQIVILGAGLATHPYRFPELLARTKVFEVDRLATQTLKKQRVNESLGGPPSNLTYVPIDFRNEALAAVLAQHGYDPLQQTFFILEGVTMYLSEEALRGTLRFVATHPRGSGIVFDFVTRALVDMLSRIDVDSVPPAMKPIIQRFLDLIRDEPWLFGIPYGSERQFLVELGLELQDSLTIGGEESLKRYLTKADGTQVGARTIAEAIARIAAQAGSAAPSTSENRNVTAERMAEQQRLMAHQIAVAVVAR